MSNCAAVVFLDALEGLQFNKARPIDLAARFFQLAANWMGGEHSVYLEQTPRGDGWLAACDPGDNGVYVVSWGKEGKTVRRRVKGRDVPCESAGWVYSHPYSVPAPGEMSLGQEVVERSPRMAWRKGGFPPEWGPVKDAVREQK